MVLVDPPLRPYSPACRCFCTRQTLGTACCLRGVAWHPNQHVVALAGYGQDAPVLLYCGEARADKQAKVRNAGCSRLILFTFNKCAELLISRQCSDELLSRGRKIVCLRNLEESSVAPPPLAHGRLPVPTKFDGRHDVFSLSNKYQWSGWLKMGSQRGRTLDIFDCSSLRSPLDVPVL